MKKLVVVLSVILMSVTAMARPDVLPSHSVRGVNNTAYASYSYGCAGVYKDNITMSIDLDNPSQGTTIVVVEVITEDNRRYTKKVVFEDGESYTYVTFNIGSGYCGSVSIIDAYVKK